MKNRHNPSRKHLAQIFAIFAFAWLWWLPSMASAQTVSQFTNTTTGSIVDSPSCATTVTRTFVVGSSFNVSDVNLGVVLNHSDRSDLRISLTSPTGTRVELFNRIGSGANNLNVLFDDEAAAAINTHTKNDQANGTSPPYPKTFRPGVPLSNFDGQNAQGTWTMVICDSVVRDTGTFIRADLYITQIVLTVADLSLTKVVNIFRPNVGTNIFYTLSVSNASTSASTATGITVLDILPSGVSFVGATGTGSYNNLNGIWTVGSLAPGASANIKITVTVTAPNGTMIINGAEIRTSSAADSDSVPNNASTNEDDDAFVAVTVGPARAAGTPPTLVCPVGTTLFDWDNVSWTAGSTNVSYPVTAIGTINFDLAINGGVYNTSPGNGGQSPARQTNFNGGTVPAQNSLLQLVDFATQSGTATAIITLPTAVPGAQFRLFDVDYAVFEFADRVTVTGIFDGNPVTPILTNSIANYVIGNSAFGDFEVPNNTGDGDVVVTFNSPVDTIIISYGNHSIAPINPLQQGVAIHDINFCLPQSIVSVTKTSAVISDGVSDANPKSLPGATVQYCISAINAGSATSRNFTFADVIAAALTYVPGSMLSGISCAAAKTVEDDDASGADESDPIGASISGSTITVTATSLGPDSALAFTFNATVK